MVLFDFRRYSSERLSRLKTGVLSPHSHETVPAKIDYCAGIVYIAEYHSNGSIERPDQKTKDEESMPEEYLKQIETAVADLRYD